VVMNRYEKEPSYLLVKRAKHPDKGFWSLPGGSVKFGETLSDAVEREVFEETKLKVDAGPQIITLDIIKEENDTKFHYILTTILCFMDKPQLPIASSDAEEVKWFNIDQISKLSPISVNTMKVLTLAQKNIQSKRLMLFHII